MRTKKPRITTEMDIKGTAKRTPATSTSPQEATEIKKKKETTDTEDKQNRLRLTPQEKPPIPPPPKTQRVQTAKEKIRTGTQERTTEKEIKQQIQKERQASSTRPRTASQSSVASDTSAGPRPSRQQTREMEIVIYVPDTEGYRKLFSRKLSPEDKENIIKKLIEGSAKITWDHPSVKSDALVREIAEGIISLEKLRFRMVKREEYFWIKETPKTK